MDSDRDDDTLAGLLDRHLPENWNDSGSREQQITRVTELFLELDSNRDPEERRLEAQRQVADEEGIEINTVQSECGRTFPSRLSRLVSGVESSTFSGVRFPRLDSYIDRH